MARFSKTNQPAPHRRSGNPSPGVGVRFKPGQKKPLFSGRPRRKIRNGYELLKHTIFVMGLRNGDGMTIDDMGYTAEEIAYLKQLSVFQFLYKALNTPWVYSPEVIETASHTNPEQIIYQVAQMTPANEPVEFPQVYAQRLGIDPDELDAEMARQRSTEYRAELASETREAYQLTRQS